MAASASLRAVLAWRAPLLVPDESDASQDAPGLSSAESAAIAALPGVDCLGGRYWEAVALWVAHNITMAQRASASGSGASAGAGAGEVTSVKVSRVSQSFGSLGASRSGRSDFGSLHSTQFGTALADLLATSPCGVPQWVS